MKNSRSWNWYVEPGDSVLTSPCHVNIQNFFNFHKQNVLCMSSTNIHFAVYTYSVIMLNLTFNNFTTNG